MQSLKRQHHELSDNFFQLKVLNQAEREGLKYPSFKDKIQDAGLHPLKATGIEIFQLNLGKMCNQTCKHCHVDAGPDRKEVMTREIMEHCLKVIRAGKDIKMVDLTGGAPEMNPDFRWFVAQISALGKKVVVRCNLTIILANPKYHDLPEFFRQHNVEVVSSLPHFSASRTDAQRGSGVFEKSVQALRMLNTAGYGKEETDLSLHLVYNPSGAFLPASQQSLEKEFKRKLKSKYNIDFNSLYTITNMPISRFLDYLLQSGNYESYMEKLVHAFNPVAAEGVMCRNTISIGWDGYLYDCDFNQMLDLRVKNPDRQHISQFSFEDLNHREIVTNQHCYGCTAGSGSSCGGTTT